MGKLAKGSTVLEAFDALSDGSANVEQELIDWLSKLYKDKQRDLSHI